MYTRKAESTCGKKDPFLHPTPGILPVNDMAVDRLLANGVVFGACNVALN
jgi:hypothetical protein